MYSKKKDDVLKRLLITVLVFALILGSLPTYHVYAEEIEGASETSNGDASEGNNEGVSGNYTDGLIDRNGMIINGIIISSGDLILPGNNGGIGGREAGTNGLVGPSDGGNHSHEYLISRQEPTCTKNGLLSMRCKECGDTITTVLDKKGHDFSVKTKVIQPTVSAGGYTIYRCSRCTATQRRDYTDPLPTPKPTATNTPTPRPTATSTPKPKKTPTPKPVATKTPTPSPTKTPIPTPTPRPHVHSYHYDGYKSVAATCTSEGYDYYVCSCGEYYTETVRKKNHVRGDIINTATCTQPGDEICYCDECNAVLWRIDAPALGHSYPDKSLEDSTCFKEGKMECERCHYIFVIPKKDHNPDLENVVIEDYDCTAATTKIHTRCINTSCNAELEYNISCDVAMNQFGIEPTHILPSPGNYNPVNSSNHEFYCEGCNQYIPEPHEYEREYYRDAEGRMHNDDVYCYHMICLKCGIERYPLLFTKEHEYEVIKEATCSIPGVKKCIDPRCNHTVEIPVCFEEHRNKGYLTQTGHSQNNRIVNGIEVDISSGYKVQYRCSHCGDFEVVTNEEPTHTFDENSRQYNGYDAVYHYFYYKCPDCGKWFEGLNSEEHGDKMKDGFVPALFRDEKRCGTYKCPCDFQVGKTHNFRLIPQPTDPDNIQISTFTKYIFQQETELNKYLIKNYGDIIFVVDAVCFDCGDRYELIFNDIIEPLSIDVKYKIGKTVISTAWSVVAVLTGIASLTGIAESTEGLKSVISAVELASTTKEVTDIVFTKLPEIRERLAETDLSQLSDEEREQLMHLLGNICNEPEKYRDEFQNKLDEKITIRHFDWAEKHYNEADFNTDVDTNNFFEFNYKFGKYMKKLLEEE